MLTYTILLSLLLFTPQEFLNLYNYQSHTSHKDAHTWHRTQFMHKVVAHTTYI